MGQSTFSGPVVSYNGFVFPATTALALEDAADPINTTDKVTGKTVVILSTGLMYTATGPAPTDDWNGSDGSTTVTPA